MLARRPCCLMNATLMVSGCTAAMNDINAAQRMRVAAAERAEANKVTVVKAAEANAEAKFLEGAHSSGRIHS